MLKDLIIYSKIYPPKLSNNLVYRDELYEMLNSGLTKKLTYLSAQSGFGKTTLLSEWISRTGQSVAWINLDENDNEPKRFFKYLIISIQKNINPNFGVEALKQTDNNYFDIDLCITLLINDFIFFPIDYLIVIDNYELIKENKISESINFIIKHLPNNVHFFISSKNKNPSINYSRLRAENELNEIDNNYLRFNFKHLKEFYKLKNIELSDQLIQTIENKTEGWILSIQLSSFFIKDNPIDDELNNKYIIDYIFDEVLKNISPDILSFLIKNSVLSIFNINLSNYINDINNANEIIDFLDKNNLFITPIDNKGEYYRFHHLFSVILLNKLHTDYPQEYEYELRNKAYNWYLKNNFINEALEQVFILKREDRILELLNDIVSSKPEININDYLKYLDKISAEQIINYPKLCFFYLKYLIYSFKLDRSQKIISILESNNFNIDNELNAYILFSKAYKNFLEENIDTSFEYIKLCMNSNKDKKDLFMLSNCYIALSSIYLRKSYFSESLAMMNKGLSTYKKSESLELEILSDMLFTLIALNKFSEAEEKFKYIKERIEKIKFSFNYESTKTKYLIAQINMSFYQNKPFEGLINSLLILLDKNENLSLLIYAYMSLANIYISSKRFSECESFIKNIEILDNNSSLPDLIFLKARFHLYKNEPELAEKLILSLDIPFDSSLSPDLYLIVLHTYISLNQIEKADKLINDFFQNHPEKESIYIVYNYIFKAIVSYLKKDEQYINDILFALKISQKNEIIAIFSDFSEQLNDVINKILSEFSKKNRNNANTVINNNYLDQILVLFYQKNKENTIENDLNNISLTKREIELLDMLEHRLTNTEICDKLCLSINTIKTHIKNIYKKLGVNNREEAILRYKALYQLNN